MNMQPVESSNIDSIGYDAETKTLRVVFNNETTYDYHGVSEQQHKSLMSAQSKGCFLNTVIKSQFPYTKVV